MACYRARLTATPGGRAARRRPSRGAGRTAARASSRSAPSDATRATSWRTTGDATSRTKCGAADHAARCARYSATDHATHRATCGERRCTWRRCSARTQRSTGAQGFAHLPPTARRWMGLRNWCRWGNVVRGWQERRTAHRSAWRTGDPKERPAAAPRWHSRAGRLPGEQRRGSA